MDTCMGYLAQVDRLMREYKEIPMYEDIFEAGDPEIAEQTAKNAKIEERSMTLLQKASAAIRAILDKISQIIGSIKEWFGASGNEKSEYQQFLKEVKQNPEFAGMKVTFHDYREINAKYEAACSAAEKGYRNLKETEKEEEPSFVKALGSDLEKIKDETAAFAKKGVTNATVATALKYAKANQENAAKVQMMIELDRSFLNVLEKEMGQKNLKKFSRKIKWINRRHKILNKIVKGRQEQALLLRDALKETICSVRGASKIAFKTAGIKGTAKAAKAAAEVGVAGVKAKRAADRMYDREKDYARDVMQSQLDHEDKTKQRRAAKEARKEKREAKRAAKKEEKSENET